MTVAVKRKASSKYLLMEEHTTIYKAICLPHPQIKPDLPKAFRSYCQLTKSTKVQLAKLKLGKCRANDAISTTKWQGKIYGSQKAVLGKHLD